ncbi:MAG TPA: phosphopantetheine-binding protein [Flavobacteriaceae bacterium]|nr:phosphopantetheine-binding protein [Flavobacteriaceae bacterium]
MEKSEIQSRLKSIIKKYLPEDVSERQINPESNLIAELNINSANMVDVALDIEDEFGIALENEDLENMRNLKSAMEIIQNKLSEE